MGIAKENPGPFTVREAPVAFRGADPPHAETSSGTIMRESANRFGNRKEPPSMANTKEKVSDAAGNVKPYLERAMYDAELREAVRNAYESARSVYEELLGNRGVSGIATRVASDKDIQDELRATIAELRRAADRVKGKEDRSGRNSGLLLIGIVLGILFNPFTGPQTRKWLSEKLLGGGDDFTYQGGSGSNGS